MIYKGHFTHSMTHTMLILYIRSNDMSSLSPKERLLKVLNKEEVDRPPVICPGGMMNAAIVDIMK